MRGISVKQLPRAKSYTSIYDIFGPFNNVLYKNSKNTEVQQTVFQATCGDSSKPCDFNNSEQLNTTSLVTSEKYHILDRDVSHKFHSTSTIFYDLDDIAKRHSFHCLTEIALSSANLMKESKIPSTLNRFGGKSNAIVQECATQIRPKLVPRDSVEEVKLKNAQRYIGNDVELSSEIFLRDNVYDRHYNKSQYSNDEITNRQQKFWSYAKYRTEYTKPILEEKKSKKKDRGKRTEDPCPCQLFSYACPCTDKKSLTELAKNSRSLTVADQITSTTKFLSESKKDSKDSKRSKMQKNNSVREDKPTNTSFVNKVDIIIPRRDSIDKDANKRDGSVKVLIDTNNMDQNSSYKSKSRRKARKVVCPKCKEKIDIASTTEDDENLKGDTNSLIYRNNTSPKALKIERNIAIDNSDTCEHEPRCEYVPVCQILPSDNVCFNHRTTRKQTSPRSSPRVIRITKACRHHPPCTVVPSCQRANVLRNNCEFIPPCLHRPRCVNLPLCVPNSKSFHYEESMNKVVDDMDICECPHTPKCKYVPICQNESLSNNPDHQIDMPSRQIQNTCEYLNEYSPAFIINPKMTCMSNKYSPQMLFPNTCNFCKSDKSCQYQCTSCKLNPSNIAKESISEDAIVFIRDVGCQYRDKNYSPKDSVLHSKFSSTSFDFVDEKINNYYTNVHTLRYQDKFTNPLSGEDLSVSTGSITSVDVDSQCPTHGHQTTHYQQSRQTGFNPKSSNSPYITAMVAQTDPEFAYTSSKKNKEFSKVDILTYPVKSRKSFLRAKYKKMFPVKRRKNSRASGLMVRFSSKKPFCPENNL